MYTSVTGVNASSGGPNDVVAGVPGGARPRNRARTAHAWGTDKRQMRRLGGAPWLVAICRNADNAAAARHRPFTKLNRRPHPAAALLRFGWLAQQLVECGLWVVDDKTLCGPSCL